MSLAELQPGDENRTWLTYTEIWRDLHVTRGALDKLVQCGAVRFCMGGQLNYFMSSRPAMEAAQRLGAPSAPFGAGVYYAMDEFSVSEAIARLTGTEDAIVAQLTSLRSAFANGATRLYQKLVACPSCGAGVDEADLRHTAHHLPCCAVCQRRTNER